jgi:hypothetical protein
MPKPNFVCNAGFLNRVVVSKDRDTGEWIGKAYNGRERVPEADCFEGTKEDAVDTARAMLQYTPEDVVVTLEKHRRVTVTLTGWGW